MLNPDDLARLKEVIEEDIPANAKDVEFISKETERKLYRVGHKFCPQHNWVYFFYDSHNLSYYKY